MLYIPMIATYMAANAAVVAGVYCSCFPMMASRYWLSGLNKREQQSEQSTQ